MLANKERKLILRFLNKPIELLGSEKISGIKLAKLRLIGDPEHQQAVDLDEPKYTSVQCDALVKSIGYRSLKIDGVPFSSKSHTIPNHFGCVVDHNGELMVGLYCAGWVKRGPVGIIDATLRDSLETFKMIKHHLELDLLPSSTTSTEQVRKLLHRGQPLVETDGWRKVNKVEIERGQALNKRREKITDKQEMLDIACN